MRKYYIDNTRWFIILLVVIFHVVSVFSSCKGMMTINAPGIPAMDCVGYMIYPWFMSVLFVVAGISAKFALKTRTPKEFAKERVRKLLIPFITYMLLVGPFAGDLSFRVNNIEQQISKLPKVMIFLIKIVSGMGPAWFLIQLFVISIIFILIYKIDKNGKLDKLGAKCNLPVLLLFYIPVFLSAQVLYVAYTFRNMLYLLMFLMGYYVFSHDEVIATLKKYSIILLIAGIIAGAAQTYFCWGVCYQNAVNGWITMLFTWLMVLTVVGLFARFFDYQNNFTKKMSGLSFGIYLFHYVPLVYIAYFVSAKMNLPYALNYIVTFVGTLVAATLLTIIFKNVPIIRTLFGFKKKKATPTKAM